MQRQCLSPLETSIRAPFRLLSWSGCVKGRQRSAVGFDEYVSLGWAIALDLVTWERSSLPKLLRCSPRFLVEESVIFIDVLHVDVWPVQREQGKGANGDLVIFV